MCVRKGALTPHPWCILPCLVPCTCVLRSPPARIFRNIYVAQVGRFTFRLLHRLEGRWTGEAEVHVAGVAQAMPDVRVCTVQRE